jgi:Zn-dependent protease with chaperone function
MFLWIAFRNACAEVATMLVLGLLVLPQSLAAQEQASKDVTTTEPAAQKIAPAPATNKADTSPKHDHHAAPVKYDVGKIGERGIGEGLNFYSLEREMAMGRELSTQVTVQARIISDPMVNDYINHLGQTIVRNSDAKVPFTIKVIDNDEVNAFALPGGYFFVNTGLIMAADNEAELAGVMAHEVAHVAARHATKSLTRNQLINLASIPLVFIGGPLVLAMEQAAGVAVPMSFLKFSRESELEADLLGLEYEYSAGYDPAAFVQFFEKLGKEQKRKFGLLSKAFATHPMTADRIKRAQEEIQEYLPPRTEYMLDTSEFQEVKAHLYSVLNGRKLRGPQNGNRPTLHRRVHPTLNTASVPADDSTNTRTTAQKSGADDDGPPTLKRRD